MAEHVTRIERFTPEGKNNTHYIAICSCGRWRSDPFRERETAEKKGMTHEHRGDEHLRALAAFERGTSSLRTQYNWYTAQAKDPFNTPEQQEMWQRLADELSPRVQPATDQEDAPLF